MFLRPSECRDVATIASIYAHHVKESTASFEIEPPDETEISRRREAVLELGLPYLIAEVDGIVAGYAYATLYRPRRAYRFTVEDSIYLHPAHTGKEIGKVLLMAIIEECERLGYRQMVAVIGGSDNAASIGLHTALGFEPAGVLRNVGFKFDKWVDSVLMQRKLGAGATASPHEIQSTQTY